MSDKLVSMKFKNVRLLKALFGDNEEHLALIEEKLDVYISYSGDSLTISGESHQVNQAKITLEGLYASLEKGLEVAPDKVVAAIKIAENAKKNSKIMETGFTGHDFIIKTRKKNIVPYSHNQLQYIQTLQKKDVTFAVGPHGTGKTYLAVAVAFSMFLNRLIDKIILAIPTERDFLVSDGNVGSLSHGLKSNLYLRPLYDSFQDMISSDSLQRCIENGEIEISPLNYLKGRTLSNAFIIIDEAQKTTAEEMKMLFSHLGEASRIAIVGHEKTEANGLSDAVAKLSHLDEVSVIKFTDADVIVNPLVAKITRAYDKSKEEI